MTPSVVAPRVLRLRSAAAYVGLSPSQVRKLVSEGAFARRTQLSTRAVGWLVEDLDSWLEARRRDSATDNGVARSRKPSRRAHA